jgi:hypothetical protein
MKVEVEAVAWPRHPIADQDDPHIEGSGCDDEPTQQVAQQDAQIGHHSLVYLVLSS